MSKYYGKIGYGIQCESLSSPGVWTDQIVERNHFGDVNRIQRKNATNGSQVNDDIQLNNEISILADPFINQYLYAIKYIEFMGCYWKVSGIEVEYPRIKITTGGLYHGETASGTA